MGLAAFNRARRLRAEQAARLKAEENIPKLTEPETEPLEPEKTEKEPESAEDIQAPGKTLDEMTYQELRALAKEQGIEEYYKMSTEELREALKEGG